MIADVHTRHCSSRFWMRWMTEVVCSCLCGWLCRAPCTNCWAFCWVGWPMSWRVWGTSTNRFILTQKDAVSRVCLLFSPPINLLFVFDFTSSSSLQSNFYYSKQHWFCTIPPYCIKHTTLLQCPSQNELREVRRRPLFCFVCIVYLLRARNCARASTVKSRMLSGLHLPILHWKLLYTLLEFKSLHEAQAFRLKAQ